MAKKILYIFDRVAHYQKELFVNLESVLAEKGDSLYLLSGSKPDGATGRVGLEDKIVKNEYKYIFKEYIVGGFTFRYQKNVIKQIKEIDPDVVVITSHVGNIIDWYLMYLKQKMGFRLVAWQCGYEFNPSKAKDFLLNRFIPGFDYHLAYHSNAANYALNYGASNYQVKVIHNTINEEKIISLGRAEAREIVKKTIPIAEKKIILYVGAILEEKRLNLLIDSMDCLGRDDLLAIIVGDGPYLDDLKKYTGDRKNIVFTGSIVEGVGPYFDVADCFVLPGTGGLAINEAMAHACPIISGYADGSADDLVIERENGYRLTQGTAQELAEKIIAVIDSDDGGRSLGEYSAELINGKFSFKNFMDRIVSGLQAVLT
ncbi:glycosyltransferase family 4 protein [Oceanicoccus sp. KOV_DT_Chl]|uniref:glycosyltransferase family 4 protein n=1 Tax=Oceanicoccus sp. KOV_DT_Chl TaxID=1904639 RepID=UPI000C7E6EFC|nr:glycosyltransferase family 4 protein [Oceanicoccus sp. KOV_DT_Chl]